MRRYATATRVSCERTKAEIEKILARYGAQQFVYATKPEAALVGFIAHGKQIQFHLPLPKKNLNEFILTPSGRHERHPEDALKAWEQACRARWRALSNSIKMKLEAVEIGITTFEEEFMAHILIPGKGLAGKVLLPKINAIYEGKTPNLIGWEKL